MYLVITEKPSVARSIAAVLGANENMRTHLKGDECVVSWCIGHLIGLAEAHVYNERYLNWRKGDLPILPDQYRFSVKEGTKAQYNALMALMNDPAYEYIVCATDAGREGELIFRLVYEASGCHKTVKRLWISSMERKAILEGFQNLKDGHLFDPLYEAALCRMKADWLVGINATRLYSVLYGTKLTVGRVMTPTLALIVEREKAIRAFQEEAIYKVQINCGFKAQTERLRDRLQAEQIAAKCNQESAFVQYVDKKKRTEQPPRLYDLTLLQREANRLFGYTAQQTLDYAQNLYEKQLLSYPRTDSQYLTRDMQENLPVFVRKLAQKFPYTAGIDLPVHVENVIRDSRVTDHHAIIPTLHFLESDWTELPAGERDIMQLVSNRLLCAVGDPHEYEETELTLKCRDDTFKTRGRRVTWMGWKIPRETYYGSMGHRLRRDVKDEDNLLPECEVGKVFHPVLASVQEGKTVPPKRYTDDTLLAAMEAAGKEKTPDDAERHGLGTPATRADILEKLIRTEYVERNGEKGNKHLVPTKKGMATIAVLPEELTSPVMTAEWEKKLKKVERGEEKVKNFMNDIHQFMETMVKNAKPVEELPSIFVKQETVVGNCPHCDKPVQEKPRGYFCSNPRCSFSIWHDNKFLTGHGITLNREQMRKLLDHHQVWIQGFMSPKTGKVYDATLVLKVLEDGKPHFSVEFKGTPKQ